MSIPWSFNRFQVNTHFSFRRQVAVMDGGDRTGGGVFSGGGDKKSPTFWDTDSQDIYYMYIYGNFPNKSEKTRSCSKKYHL